VTRRAWPRPLFARPKSSPRRRPRIGALEDRPARRRST